MAAVGQEFQPGDLVANSGIYKVIHDPAHTKEHEVTIVAHRHFPPCRGCKHPRFVLVRAAHHIEDHEQFKGM
jgi:hypothetical protein